MRVEGCIALRVHSGIPLAREEPRVHFVCAADVQVPEDAPLCALVKEFRGIKPL